MKNFDLDQIGKLGGLWVGRAQVPLQGVDVAVDVVAGQARLTVCQRWRNDEAEPVEAVYVFPLPPRAAVTGLQIACGGELTVAELDEREAAFAQYDKAVLDGHGAALLEQERPDVFTLSLANLLPGETTEVTLTLVQPLHADEGSLRWVLPTVVAPRYIAGTAKGDRTGHGTAEPTDRVPDADRITPPIGDAPYRLHVRGRVQLGAKVGVSSPSHGAALAVTGEGQFELHGWPLDRDLIVDIAGELAAPAGVVCQAPTGQLPGIVAATIVPDLGIGPRAPLDVVFVLDRSGSMEGAAMPAAKKALRLCLRHLRQGDRFQIIAFDDRLALLGSALQPFDDAAMRRADQWLDGIGPRGGTELLQAMEAALGLTAGGLIVLLTDGQIGNEDEVLRRTLQLCRGARICSLAIGTAVSDALLADMARQTHGAIERVHPDDRLDERVLQLFAKATAARVTGVKVAWHGVDVGDLCPQEPADLCDGVPWVLAGTWQSAGAGELEVSGTGPAGPFAIRLPVVLDASAPELPGLAQVWAAQRIAELDALSATGRRAGTVRQEIVRISKQYGVLSKHTSFVLVQKRQGDRRAKGLPELRVVPVAAADGWAMLRSPALPPMQFAAYHTATPAGVMAMSFVSAPPPSPMPGSARRMRSPSAPLPPPPSPSASAPSFLSKVQSFLSSPPVPPAASAITGQFAVFDASDAVAAAEPAPTDPVEAILMRQRADGLWGAAADDWRETAKALTALADAGVTSAHPLHGAPIKKALEALCARAEQGERGSALLAALRAGLRLASGGRTRARVERALAGLAQA